MDGRNIDDRLGGGIDATRVLAGAAILGVGAGIDRVLGGAGSGASSESDRSAAVPFYGSRQAGIVTPAQEFANIAAFDLKSDSSEDLRRR